MSSHPILGRRGAGYRERAWIKNLSLYKFAAVWEGKRRIFIPYITPFKGHPWTSQMCEYLLLHRLEKLEDISRLKWGMKWRTRPKAACLPITCMTRHAGCSLRTGHCRKKRQGLVSLFSRSCPPRLSLLSFITQLCNVPFHLPDELIPDMNYLHNISKTILNDTQRRNKKKITSLKICISVCKCSWT
jgi:hypothetical protein